MRRERKSCDALLLVSRGVLPLSFIISLFFSFSIAQILFLCCSTLNLPNYGVDYPKLEKRNISAC